jgi:hypothetical protein
MLKNTVSKNHLLKYITYCDNINKESTINLHLSSKIININLIIDIENTINTTNNTITLYNNYFISKIKLFILLYFYFFFKPYLKVVKIINFNKTIKNQKIIPLYILTFNKYSFIHNLLDSNLRQQIRKMNCQIISKNMYNNNYSYTINKGEILASYLNEYYNYAKYFFNSYHDLTSFKIILYLKYLKKIAN